MVYRSQMSEPKRIRAPRPPSPTPAMVVRSMVRWMLSTPRYVGWRLLDRVRGRRKTEHKARRMRQAIESIGPMGVRVGRQLSMRIDLMPLEFSMELASMREERGPMPAALVISRVEKATGKPMAEVFTDFDPAPIATSTVDCVYKARLLDGTDVAVKVRREGIRVQILADLVALSWYMRLFEILTIARPGLFNHLRVELVELANEELDYNNQARFQTLFRERAARDRLDYVTAPRVHARLSNHAVMVTDRPADGVLLSDIIEAIERGDKVQLDRWAQLKIDPRKLGRRLLQVTWWASMENLFFNAQPSDDQILVLPGNQLVFLDFEDCGTLSGQNKRQLREVLASLARDNVSGAAQALVQMLSPLPFIDVYDFTKRIESGLWHELFALRDAEAGWWERTTIGLWRTVLKAAREDHVSVRLEIIRLMRSALTYDTMAVRLRPDLDLLGEFERYRVKADRRASRRYRRDMEQRDPEDLQAASVARWARVTEGAGRLGLWLENTAENLPVSNLALSGKAAYAVSQGFKLATASLLMLLIGMAFDATLTGATWTEWGTVERVVAVTLHPLYGVLVFAVASLTLRRVLFRLDDKGEG